MAAIGKIRSWGPVLVGIIALALFGFIAGDMWRSCETTGNQQRQQVGEVLGKKMSYTEYEGMIQEYENVLKTMGYEMNTDEARNELRDYVWQNFVQNTVLEKECKKLGLAVTDEEMANVLKEGTSPVLSQLRLLPQMQPVLTQFFNQQTGRFDYSQVTYIYNALKQLHCRKHFALRDGAVSFNGAARVFGAVCSDRGGNNPLRIGNLVIAVILIPITALRRRPVVAILQCTAGASCCG